MAFCARHCHPKGVRTCVAGGRHSHQCMVNGSFVIDLSGLKGVTVNEEEKYVNVMGGSLQGEIDEAIEPFGLATTAGHVASTGCGGLIIQGGHGYLERKFGMVVDNLLQVEMVVADGTVVIADEEQRAGTSESSYDSESACIPCRRRFTRGSAYMLRLARDRGFLTALPSSGPSRG